ncbi:MAG: hypothetical protein ACRELA_13160 [Candidatus Rokuibacteriota bacterium]
MTETSDAPAIPPGAFRIDREGLWRHEGHEVTHPGVLRNLYANLRVDPDGHFLQVGPARVPVSVEEAPFVVTRLGPDADGLLRVHLTDGTDESVAPESVWIGARETPYCRVKAGRFIARLSVSAWLQLANFVQEEPGSGRMTLVIGPRRMPLDRRP